VSDKVDAWVSDNSCSAAAAESMIPTPCEVMKMKTDLNNKEA